MVAAPVAAIDCGTNSTRLLVAAADGTTIDRRMHITRLGHGVDRTHLLDPAAIARTVAVLREYRQVMDDLGVTGVRITATSAARDATNREDFFRAAEEVVGVRPELLSGEEEAAPVVCRRHRVTRSRRRPIPGGRHRGWLHRVRGGA